MPAPIMLGCTLVEVPGGSRTRSSTARTVRTTRRHVNGRAALRSPRYVASCVVVVLLAAVALVLAGCGGGSGTGTTGSSSAATGPVGYNMAGPQAEVHISQQTLDAAPAAWVLATPQSAVRSYLAWTSYAYRIATSDVASPTMGADEGVRVDSYIQYNLEKSRLIDQTLSSISFGKASVEGTHTLVATHEKWTYSYVSIGAGNKVLGGPYVATYNSTYTMVKSGKDWVVYAVAAKALGTVK
jgi:hypothetical protein